jgi:outer membrane protein with beta-barrel domain
VLPGFKPNRWIFKTKPRLSSASPELDNAVPMKKSAAVLICCVLCAWAGKAHAQVVASATRSPLSLSAGGMGSIFQPDYDGTGVAEQSATPLIGLGAYVDLRVRHWIQFEAEGRWLRFNQFENIYEDNYLIGPKVPIHETRRFRPYAKALIGYGKMNFQYNFAYGHFTDVALGGGVDMPLGNRLSLRAADFEYQIWPNWINGTVKPYGVSVGVAYRIF